MSKEFNKTLFEKIAKGNTPSIKENGDIEELFSTLPTDIPQVKLESFFCNLY